MLPLQMWASEAGGGEGVGGSGMGPVVRRAGRERQIQEGASDSVDVMVMISIL